MWLEALLCLQRLIRRSLASFVTTYMEDEAEKLMQDALAKNFIDYEEYPVSADIQVCRDAVIPLATCTLNPSKSTRLEVCNLQRDFLLWRAILHLTVRCFVLRCCASVQGRDRALGFRYRRAMLTIVGSLRVDDRPAVQLPRA